MIQALLQRLIENLGTLFEVLLILLSWIVGGVSLRRTHKAMQRHKTRVLAELDAVRSTMKDELIHMQNRLNEEIARMQASLARLLMVDKKIPEACELLTEYLGSNPEDVQARWHRGQCYERMREWLLALEDYEVVLGQPRHTTQGPTEGEVLLAAGRVLHNLGRHTEAIEKLTRALEHPCPPKNRREAIVLLGNSTRLAGSPDKALEVYKRCLELFPADANAAVGVAMAMADTGKIPEALAWLDQRLQQHPEGASSYLRAKAEIHLIGGEMDKALAAFDRAIQIDPRDTKPYEGKGTIFLCFARQAWLSNKPTEAANLARAAQEALVQGGRMAPDSYRPVFHNLLAQAELLLGNPRKAAEHGRSSVELKPDYWQNHAALAMTYAWSGDWKDVRTSTERALANERIQESRNGILWIEFYYCLSLLELEGLTNHTAQRTYALLKRIPHTFSPALFDFWPVLKRRLVDIASSEGQRFVKAFEDAREAAELCKQLERLGPQSQEP